MSRGSNALISAYAKLDWARSRHTEMLRLFEEFALTPSPDDRPYGIEFQRQAKPEGRVVARFIIESAMPEQMTMLAADLVHNTRVVLDHTLARFKDLFGGDSGQGSFPICRTPDQWVERVERGRKSPLDGLTESPAFDFIKGEQPMHRKDPQNDPLVVLNHLDNTDKHRLLQLAFVYPQERNGLSLIEQTDLDRIVTSISLWEEGQPLLHGTKLASFLIKGRSERPPLAARPEASIGFAIGDPAVGRVQFTEMIERVQNIVNGAARIIAEA